MRYRRWITISAVPLTALVAACSDGFGPRSTAHTPDASASSRSVEPVLTQSPDGRVVIATGRLADSLVRATAAARAAKGDSALQIAIDASPLWRAGNDIAAQSRDPHRDPTSGGVHALITEIGEISEASFPPASIDAHATIPSLNTGAANGTVTAKANYTGSDAHADMTFGAKDDKGKQVVPEATAHGDDGHTLQKLTCAGAILANDLGSAISACLFWSGQVTAAGNASVQYTCGVHLYGSGQYSAWYEIPVPVVSGVGADGKPSYSVQTARFGQSPLTAEATVEAYNGKCRPPVASLTASADGSSGADLSITVPSGSSVSVALDASASQAGSAAISTYSWSGAVGNGATASADIDQSAGFSVVVTDENDLTASATASVNITFDCEDPAADNYLAEGDCTYSPPTCDDPEASNYGAVGDCIYPPPPPDVCEDPEADNYGSQGACTYPPPPATCTDPSADNYGGYGDCTYSNPSDPGPGSDPGDGGGSPDDPCAYEIFDDPFCDPDPIYADRVGPTHGRAGVHVLGVHRSIAHADPTAYYVVLVDSWKNGSLLSMVGRFPHKNGFVDAIYLPSANPTAQGFTLAVRALQQDRAQKARMANGRRVIRIGGDGSQTFTRQDGVAVSLSRLALVPPSALGKMEGDFRSGVMAKLTRAPKKASKHMKAVQMIKWPRQ